MEEASSANRCLSLQSFFAGVCFHPCLPVSYEGSKLSVATTGSPPVNFEGLQGTQCHLTIPNFQNERFLAGTYRLQLIHLHITILFILHYQFYTLYCTSDFFFSFLTFTPTYLTLKPICILVSALSNTNQPYLGYHISSYHPSDLRPSGSGGDVPDCVTNLCLDMPLSRMPP